jgi:hypothetical protein
MFDCVHRHIHKSSVMYSVHLVQCTCYNIFDEFILIILNNDDICKQHMEDHTVYISIIQLCIKTYSNVFKSRFLTAKYYNLLYVE